MKKDMITIRLWMGYALVSLLPVVPLLGQISSISIGCPNQASAGSIISCSLGLSLRAGDSIDSLTFGVAVTPNGSAPTLTTGQLSFSESISGPFKSTGGTNNSISVLWSGLNPALSGNPALGSLGFSLPASASIAQSYSVTITGAGASSGNNPVALLIGSASTVSILGPNLSILKAHSGSFTQGQNGATYTVTVSNAALAGPTSGTVTVTETVPSGMTLVSMAGTGWTCPAGGTACSRSDALNGGVSYPAITIAVNVGASATSPQVNSVSVSGGGSATASFGDSTTINPKSAVLNISKSHNGNFTQGQTGATYSVSVSSGASAGPTTGTVTVTETVPSGLTLVSMSGSGWNCASNICSRNDALSPGTSYPALTVTVNVSATATSPQVNSVSVSGGGTGGAATTDSTTIVAKPPVLGISKTHSGNFTKLQTGATYSVIVSNGISGGATAGTVTVTETPPSGLTLVSMSGTGWTCTVSTCTRSDVLPPASSYPAITVTVNVAATATSPQVNSVSVSGGGGVGASWSDSTLIDPGPNPIIIDPYLNRTALAFAAKSDGSGSTPPQDVSLTASGSASAWTAVSNSPWLAVTNGAGVGNGKFAVSIVPSALPAPGTYTGTITVNVPGATNGPLTVNCTLTVKSVTTVPFGSFDTPADFATGISGSIAVTGWALDDIGVKQVTIWRDPIGPEPVRPNGYVYIGDAMFVAGARPDVERSFPSAPLAYRAGWGYMMLTYGLPAQGNGTYRIHALATDEEGNQVKLGTKTITVDNAHSVKPFGAIDTPAPGETVSGTVTVSGWALTPPPCGIATDGSTISVYVNGADRGHPTYSQSRPDVGSIFPGYTNRNFAGGTFSLNSMLYANGLSTLAWVVTDNCGHVDGMGSRYFNILNATTAASADPAPPIDQTLQLRTARLRRPTAPAASYPAYRHGYDWTATLTPIRQAGDRLLESIELKELDRLELHLPAGLQWWAALRFNDELRELPIGSTFDPEGAIFYWQLGPGFLGEFILEFRAGDGTVLSIPVRVATPTAPVVAP